MTDDVRADETQPAGPSPFAQAMDAAAATADDGTQRAVEFLPAKLEDLLALRLDVRDQLARSPSDSALRCVRPWIWRPESTGRPMTTAGQDVGMELRLSRYAAPRRPSLGHATGETSCD